MSTDNDNFLEIVNTCYDNMQIAYKLYNCWLLRYLLFSIQSM
jgi:hypothetical protein